MIDSIVGSFGTIFQVVSDPFVTDFCTIILEEIQEIRLKEWSVEKPVTPHFLSGLSILFTICHSAIHPLDISILFSNFLNACNHPNIFETPED